MLKETGCKRTPAALSSGNIETSEVLKLKYEQEQRLKGKTDLLNIIPEYLDELAKEYYQFLVSELEVSNLLGNLDVPILEQAADCLSKMRYCDNILKQDGIIIEMPDRYGNLQPREHPAVGTKQKYLTQFRFLCNQLGLSPASRAALVGLKIQKKEKDNDPLLKVLEQD